MSVFDRFHHDVVVIAREDGSIVAAGVRADVQSKKIYINNASLEIRPGYVISRQQPSGVVDEFIVEDPGFVRGMHPSIPAHFAITYHRKDAGPRPTPTQYIASGPNARINIGSIDASCNTTVGAEELRRLFDDLAKAIESGIQLASQREALHRSADDLKEAVGTSTFLDRYKAFISLAADHVTLISPFIPALTQMLTH